LKTFKASVRSGNQGLEPPPLRIQRCRFTCPAKIQPRKISFVSKVRKKLGRRKIVVLDGVSLAALISACFQPGNALN